MDDLISRADAIRIAEQGQVQGYEWQFKKLVLLPSARKIGKWIDAYPDIEPNPLFMYGICSECGFEQRISNKLNFCPNCGTDMRNAIKPKSCFECEYSVDYSDDTVMCSEIKNMVSTSQNRDMIPPFCPKYLR